MRTMYFDCGMGAAGDMLTAALLELLPEPEEFIREFEALKIPGVKMTREASVKCGIFGTHVSVTVDGVEEESVDHVHGHAHGHGEQPAHAHEHGEQPAHTHGHGEEPAHAHEHGEQPAHTHGHGEQPAHAHEAEAMHKKDHTHEEGHTHTHSHTHAHHHTSLHDIEHLVRDHLALPEKVKNDVMAVYQLIAEAESHAHNVPVTDIHFHEVGTLDAVADITAVCMLMDRLAPDAVVVSPVHVGSGQVHCAHGILPVPAPATAYILKDVPIYGGSVKGELCTPTGAALLKHFATRFGDMPVMKTTAIGYGMGKKDFEAANCVRVFLGETQENKDVQADFRASAQNGAASDSADKGFLTDTVIELSCNLDDMTAEAVGFAVERLFDAGALEVYTLAAGMKKSRPGVLLTVLCGEEKREAMVGLLFRHTTTIGVREAKMARYVLGRKLTTVQTPYGTVHRKDSEGYGVSRSKYEYEDVARIAREQGMSLEEVYKKIQ